MVLRLMANLAGLIAELLQAFILGNRAINAAQSTANVIRLANACVIAIAVIAFVTFRWLGFDQGIKGSDSLISTPPRT